MALQQPMDYTINLPDSYTMAMRGLQDRFNLSEMGFRQRMRDLAESDLMEQIKRRKEYEKEVEAIMGGAQPLGTETPTPSRGPTQQAGIPQTAPFGGSFYPAGGEQVPTATGMGQTAQPPTVDQPGMASQFSSDINRARSMPTYENIMRIIAKYPESQKNWKTVLDNMNEEKRNATIDKLQKVYTSVITGKPEYAINYLEEEARAAENSGKQMEARQARATIDVIKNDPKSFVPAAATNLAMAMGVEKFSQNYKQLQDAYADSLLLGSRVKQEGAEADIKQAEAVASGQYYTGRAQEQAVKGEFAREEAQTQIDKRKHDIKMAELNYKLDQQRVALSRESNNLQRQKLQLDIAQTQDKMAKEARAFESDKNASISNVITPLNQVRELLSPENAEARKWATGITAGSAFWAGTEAKTYAGKVDQLSNMLALQNIDKLKGAISDKDILFLKNIGANLDRWQSSKNFEKELTKVESILSSAARKKAEQFGSTYFNRSAVMKQAESTRRKDQSATDRYNELVQEASDKGILVI